MPNDKMTKAYPGQIWHINTAKIQINLLKDKKINTNVYIYIFLEYGLNTNKNSVKNICLPGYDYSFL
jgi:hypothetical protein